MKIQLIAVKRTLREYDTVQRYYNPFAGTRLVYPAEQQDSYRQYCQPSGASGGDSSPFPIMPDLWFAGLSFAARNKLKPVDLTGRRTISLARGSIFDSGSDSWRVQIVMLVAIAVEGNVEVVVDPNHMMRIANRLAAAGVPHIVRMLEDGSDEPIWNLSDALEQLLTEE